MGSHPRGRPSECTGTLPVLYSIHPLPGDCHPPILQPMEKQVIGQHLVTGTKVYKNIHLISQP